MGNDNAAIRWLEIRALCLAAVVVACGACARCGVGSPLRLSVDHVTTFDDGSSDPTQVRHERQDRNLVISFTSNRDHGFAMVCLLPDEVAFDASGFVALEFSVPHADAELPLEVKLEHIDSSCPTCQCRLYDNRAKGLPRAPGGKVRLTLDRCKHVLSEVARVCFATNVDRWVAKRGTFSFELGDVTFVRR